MWRLDDDDDDDDDDPNDVDDDDKNADGDENAADNDNDDLLPYRQYLVDVWTANHNVTIKNYVSW